MAKAFAGLVYILLWSFVKYCNGSGSIAFASRKVSVSGKSVSVERILCLKSKNKCSLKFLQCPPQCPQRKPTDQKAKACFADCSPKCEATCKNRVTSCNGYGSVCYDPRFIGGDGVMFYFHGGKDQNYCLVSDPPNNLHINAHLIGTRPRGRPRDYTWVQSLGIRFASHVLTVGADRASTWHHNTDHLSFTFDHRHVIVARSHVAQWISPDGSVKIERTADTNSAVIYLSGSAEISVRAVAISEHENRVHNYQLPPDDSFVHLDMQFNLLNLSGAVEGILGQTYRPGFVSPVKSGVPMPVMGGENKYRTSSLLSADCAVCNPVKAESAIVDEEEMNGVSVSECSSRFGYAGIVCRR